MKTLELKIPPPVVAVLAGVFMWAVARMGPAFELPFSARAGAFAGIALVGGIVALLGARELRRANTTANPLQPGNSSALVASGIYRHTRNPMYVGLALVLSGWAVFLGSAFAVTGIVLFVLYINRFQIAPEENILAAKFGASYDEYRARVRRWL